MTTEYSESELAMVNLLEKHVNAELQGDLDTTMATMSEDPHLFNIPTMMGGNGYDGVRSFYKNHLVGKFFSTRCNDESGIANGRNQSNS